MAHWDFFLSHAGPDIQVAERLYDALDPHARVFLDKRNLRAGAQWDLDVSRAQRDSHITVSLVSANTDFSYYQREEHAVAIALARAEEDKHHVIPVYLNRQPNDIFAKPYGFELLHSLFAPETNDLSKVAQELLGELRKFKRTSLEQYTELLDIDGYKVPYLPFANYCKGPLAEILSTPVRVQREATKFELDAAFPAVLLGAQFRNDPSCRLSSYDSTGTELRVALVETSYRDYLISSEHLDDPLPNDNTKTFRDAFGSLIRDSNGNLRPFNLTNICGVGVFIVSEDNHVIVTRHSDGSHVYPGRMTYSASGTMKWGAYPDPSMEIIRKCFHETNHQVNPDKLRLIGFGVDARKLYFQFSFFEKTAGRLPEVRDRLKGVDHHEIAFELEPVVEHLISNCWEPAAEATLLAMCVAEFGRELVSNALSAHKARWARRIMRDEWDYRASRPFLLPDMSVRYPLAQLEQESKKYVDAVMRFMGHDVKDADVLEVGCGTGRITERLERKAKTITCIDLCDRMILRNKQRLGNRAERINYVNEFAQEYAPKQRFDVAVCSLVLIHNVDDAQFNDLIEMLCQHAGVIYVFEDVTQNRGTSPHTKLRSEEHIREAFARYDNHDEGKERHFQLFGDELVFLRFLPRRSYES